MSTHEHRTASPEAKSIAFGVVTVSDTRSLKDDFGGTEAVRLIEGAGFAVRERRMVHDEVVAIRDATAALLEAGTCDAIVFTGGTGFSPRDVTVEALEPWFEKRIDGFGELFRALSFSEIGAAAMLSRACAGIVAGVAVFATPGSPAGVRLALERLILPELRHLVGQLRRPEQRSHHAHNRPSEDLLGP